MRPPSRDDFADIAVGDRVRVKTSGWTGEVVKRGIPANGWKVRWDDPRFGATESWVRWAELEKEEAR